MANSELTKEVELTLYGYDLRAQTIELVDKAKERSPEYAQGFIDGYNHQAEQTRKWAIAINDAYRVNIPSK